MHLLNWMTGVKCIASLHIVVSNGAIQNQYPFLTPIFPPPTRSPPARRRRARPTLGGIDQRDGGIPATRPPLPRGIELHNVQIELLDKQSKLNGASKIRTPHGHASAPTKKMPL
jgi:hypothetical protein